MYSAWTKHLKDPEEKIEFEKTVYGSRRVLNRIKDLMAHEEKALESSERSIKDFEDTNWAYKQAFRNGYKSCLAQVNKLVDLDQQQFPTMEKTNE